MADIFEYCVKDVLFKPISERKFFHAVLRVFHTIDLIDSLQTCMNGRINLRIALTL
ncbi:hypothetical protein C1646_690383 [Rhizophagus diaphanus]|nr:hypothetical protein C1646_690383 [Rhizophagus diaphanus] [Rhizophagus sp. MUCL 43196]